MLLLLVGVLVLAAFGLLVRDGLLRTFDEAWTEAVVRRRTATWTELSYWASQLGDVVPTIVWASLVACLAAWRWGRPREGVLLGAALALEVVLFLVLTAVVERPRPPGVGLDVVPFTSAYPSGHVAASVVLWGFVAVLVWRAGAAPGWRTVALGWAVLAPALVAWARLYRGMHWPTDLLAGLVVGLLALASVVRLGRPGLEARRPLRARSE